MENSRRGHQANTDAASKISAPQASPLPTDQSAASAQQAQCSAPSDVLETERVGQRERASTGNQGANVLSAFQTHHLSLKSYPVLDFSNGQASFTMVPHGLFINGPCFDYPYL